MMLPISKKDENQYRKDVESNFEKFVEYYRGVGFSNIFYVGENVEKNEKNIEKIWNHVVSKAWDNSNDLGLRELEMGNCKENEWEKMADSYFGASLEGLISIIVY